MYPHTFVYVNISNDGTFGIDLIYGINMPHIKYKRPVSLVVAVRG